jgi:hypothetical protein
MKRKIYFKLLHLLAPGLSLVVFLASCSLPTRSSGMPNATQMSELNQLVCPNIPVSRQILPAVPYDEPYGDCGLIGKSAEIEAWLIELERIASSCQANRDANWAIVLEVRASLDAQVDVLYSPTLEPYAGVLLPPLCLNNERAIETLSPSLDIPTSRYYTNWLKTIGEHVVQYCRMIDNLVQPLWQACDSIRFNQGCGPLPSGSYHTMIQSYMDSAQLKYDFSNSFYRDALQTSGWGNFRTSFNEAYITCPQLASLPTFTFYADTSCRQAPDLTSDVVTDFLQKQDVPIDGFTKNDQLWWQIVVPDSNDHCWVPDSSGLVTGSLEKVEEVGVFSMSPTPDLLTTPKLLTSTPMLVPTLISTKIPTKEPSPTPTVEFQCSLFMDDKSCNAQPKCIWIFDKTPYCANR